MNDPKEVLSYMYVDGAGYDANRNIFFVTPSGQRVSFYSQQARALNLVWALTQEGIATPNLEVAVVGAGVAGVTVACALAGRGCHVDLYDEAARPLWRQVAARHRVMHPRLNQWGTEADHVKFLLPITNLPFLNWYYSSCDIAVTAMLKDLEAFQSSTRIRFHGKTLIKQLDPDIDSEGRKVRVIAKDKGQVGLYDIVICCTGFTAEKDPKGGDVNEYWAPDDIERLKARGLLDNYVVSGGGDGGMVDALRLAYNYEGGRLAFRVAVAMSIHLPELLEKIANEERAPSKPSPRDSVYAEVAQYIANTDNERAAPVRALLDVALTNESPKHQVYLVEKRVATEGPSQSRGAPIHKLLTVYAINAKRINYRRGQVPALRGKKESVAVDKIEFQKSESHFVYRNGAPERLDVLAEDVRKKLSDNLERANKVNWALVFDPSELSFPHLPRQHDRKSPEFWEHHGALLRRAFRQVDEDAVAYMEGEEFYLAAPKFDFLPERLFGVAVKRAEDLPPMTIKAL